MRILLVEDEPEIAKLLGDILHRQKFIFDIAPDLDFAKEALRSHDYALVILDRLLTDGDGLDLVSFARKKGMDNRFLVLSALGDLSDKVTGLDVGADDYLVKPFEPEELLARIRALLRRPVSRKQTVYKCGKLRYDRESKTVQIHDEVVIFSRRELAIFEVLIRSAGHVVLREKIEAAVYGYDDEIKSNTIEAHMSRIRKLLKLRKSGARIHAVRGVGYILKAESDD